MLDPLKPDPRERCHRGREVRHRNRWQAYHDQIGYPDRHEWWLDGYEWWSGEISPEQAARRLREVSVGAKSPAAAR